MARCMLLQANLSTGFWAEAVSTANYLRNRCSTKSLNGKTPFEIWTNRVPSLKHLRTFGMKAYILNKDPRKKKFDSRSKTGIFIGYSDKSKAYRVWIPSERRVVVSRDVKILENSCYKNISKDHQCDDTNKELTPNKTSTIYISSEEDTKSLDEVHLDASNNEREELEEINEQVCEDLCRTRGRPKILRTGKRGRPRKLFHHQITPTTDNCNPEKGIEEEDIEEEDAEETQLNLNNKNKNESEGNMDHEANLVMQAANMTEISMDEAMNGDDHKEWRQAIKSEIKNLIKNNTFEIVERPTGGKVIGCRVVLTNKFKSDGSLEKRKVRVIAKGFAQRPGVDFIDTFSPVARLESIRLIMATAVELNMSIEQIDITGAYLYGYLQEDIYMEKPILLEDCLKELINDRNEKKQIRAVAKELIKDLNNSNNAVCYLKRAIYGLKQAGRQWHERLSKKLKELNLEPTISDPCVYRGRRESHTLYMIIYVDDMLITSTDPNWIKSIKMELFKTFDMKDLGKANLLFRDRDTTRTRKNHSISKKIHLGLTKEIWHGKL